MTGKKEDSTAKNKLSIEADQLAKAADSTSSKKLQEKFDDVFGKEGNASSASSNKKSENTRTMEDERSTRIFNAQTLKEELKTGSHDISDLNLNFSVNEDHTSSEELKMKIEEDSENLDEQVKAEDAPAQTAEPSPRKEDKEERKEEIEISLDFNSADMEVETSHKTEMKGEEIPTTPSQKHNESNEDLKRVTDLFSLDNIEEVAEKKLENDSKDVKEAADVKSELNFEIQSEINTSDPETEVMPEVEKENKNKKEQQFKGTSSPLSPAESSFVDLSEIRQASKQVEGHYHDELVRLQTNIRNLRLERKKLLDEIERLENKALRLNQENLSLLAENDEYKIEIGLLKKKKKDQSENTEYQLQLSEERREITEVKLKKAEEELRLMQKQNRLDVSKIRAHEKELESQLELLRSDTAIQIAGRDQKIMELKRQIDILEFDREGMQARDSEFKKEKQMLEEKVEKMLKALKTTIGMVEAEAPVGLRADNLRKLKIT